MHPEQTILELRAALEQSPSNGILRGALARLLAPVGRHAEAEVEHRKVLAASPEDVDAKLALAECYHAQGKDSHALVLLDALKLRGQLEGRAAVFAARLHLRAGELVAAQALYTGAIRHDPALADADLARALRARPPLRVPRRVRQGDRSLAHRADGASLLRLRGLADLDPRARDRRPARGTRLAGVAGAQAQARARLPPPAVRAVAAGRVVRPAVAPRRRAPASPSASWRRCASRGPSRWWSCLGARGGVAGRAFRGLGACRSPICAAWPAPARCSHGRRGSARGPWPSPAWRPCCRSRSTKASCARASPATMIWPSNRSSSDWRCFRSHCSPLEATRRIDGDLGGFGCSPAWCIG